MILSIKVLIFFFNLEKKKGIKFNFNYGIGVLNILFLKVDFYEC